jgi:cob(I)alamin adenosyltransferase
MTIYTRRGDHGETSLADGSRVSKHSVRVEAYGTVDEANSAVGLARAATADELLTDVLRFAQQRLFNCSALLADPTEARSATAPSVSAKDVAALESAIDRFESLAGAQKNFVVEGGCEAAARLHVARALVRRAERRATALSAESPVDDHVLAFLNRLSDALFAAARYANVRAGVTEEAWDPEARRPLGDD